LGETAPFKVYVVKFRPADFAIGDDMKKRKGEERKGNVHKVTSTYVYLIVAKSAK